MGAAASRCTVVNKAIYTVKVEVFDAKDSNGAAPKQTITLLPGQSSDIKLKKAADLRLSGDGRSQNLIRAMPGQTIAIPGIRSGSDSRPMQIPTSPFVTSTEASVPPNSPKAAKKAAQAPIDSAHEPHAEMTQPANSWLDERRSNGKDELQQLVRRLQREELEGRHKAAPHAVQRDDSIRAIRAS